MTQEIQLCSNDQVLLHMRNAFDNLFLYNDNERVYFNQTAKNYALEMAKTLRTNPTFMNGKIPRLVAAAIIYITGIMGGFNATQAQVARFFGANEATISKYYRIVRKELASTCDWLR